ncbi:hypothetical protein SAMN02982917_5623 [Azospirillum oryzae]|uniref:Macro domain-containing protein n=1 Tax=Azospirillum oryzae TaxID=286727 RepID=A0A1X7HCI4_9PROT|nr:hypothetical protein [Azospirillum oryzae]SMF83849.1 hypothetical protein SAMN02982917_5623 [Azospirillum oryzae]
MLRYIFIEHAHEYIKKRLNQGPFLVAAKGFLWLVALTLAGPSVIEIVIQISILIVDSRCGEQGKSVAATIQKLNELVHGSDSMLTIILSAFSSAFFVMSFIFARKKEVKLNNFKTIRGPVEIGSFLIYCYLGNVAHINEVDVIVTSEDNSLDLGSISGTSVSGRIRKLAATKNEAGEVVTDNIKIFLDEWKRRIGKSSNFELGTCVFLDNSYGASENNVKSIILSVAITRDENGKADISGAAISAIIDKCVRHAHASNYDSIFFPVFGLGSGGVAPDKALSYFVDGILSCAGKYKSKTKIYIGVYRENDMRDLVIFLEKLKRKARSSSR